MKEILNLRPILQKQMAIWKLDMVLNYLKQLDDEISANSLHENKKVLSPLCHNKYF